MRIIRILGISVAVLLVVIVAAVFLIDANRFRPALETELSAVLGRQVKIADLKVSLLHGGVSADGLFVADDPKFSHDPFVSAKSLEIGVEFWPFVFSRKLIVTDPASGRQLAALAAGTGHWNSPIVIGGRIILPVGNADDDNTTGQLFIYHLPGR